MWAGVRIWAAVSPEELSTQERAPYSMVTGMEGGSRWTRCSMGLLAQPRDSDMARNPTSPLGEQSGIEFLPVLTLQHQNKSYFLHQSSSSGWAEACGGSPGGLGVAVVDVLRHGVVLKHVLKLPFEIGAKSVDQARTCTQARVVMVTALDKPANS